MKVRCRITNSSQIIMKKRIVDVDDDNSALRTIKKRPLMLSKSLSTDDKTDKNKLSARECRIRKNMRYQYLDELISASEQAILKLRAEVKELENQCVEIDKQNGYQLQFYGYMNSFNGPASI